jgi:hypothetical protein
MKTQKTLVLCCTLFMVSEVLAADEVAKKPGKPLTTVSPSAKNASSGLQPPGIKPAELQPPGIKPAELQPPGIKPADLQPPGIKPQSQK